jgi:hypothetical protein
VIGHNCYLPLAFGRNLIEHSQTLTGVKIPGARNAASDPPLCAVSHNLDSPGFRKKAFLPRCGVSAISWLLAYHSQSPHR